MKRTIKGGTVLTASDEYAADVIIEDGKITGIVKPGNGPSDGETTDAKGCYVIPGGIDAHTHLDMVTLSDVASNGTARTDPSSAT